MYQHTTRFNRRITMTRYESNDPTLGPRVQSTRAPAAPPTQLDTGALLLSVSRSAGPRVHGARINGRCKIEKLSCTIRERRGEVVSHSVFMHVVSSHADALSRAQERDHRSYSFSCFNRVRKLPCDAKLHFVFLSPGTRSAHTTTTVACLKSYAAADHVVNVAPAPRRFNS
jgi:hypothetical protein